MARGNSQGGSRSLSASARSELSGSGEIIGSGTDTFSNAESNLSNLYKRSYENNNLTEKQELITDSGFGLSKNVGYFLQKNANDLIKIKEKGKIDKVVTGALRNDLQIQQELKPDLIYAIRKDIGGDPTDKELDDIVKKEFEPQLQSLKEFIQYSIDDFISSKVGNNRYNITQLYSDAQKFHRTEVYDVSFETSYNTRIMNLMNKASEKYLQEIEKRIKNA